jgi:hypothetical protein
VVRPPEVEHLDARGWTWGEVYDAAVVLIIVFAVGVISLSMGIVFVLVVVER